jgi:hypothetical protein
MVKHIKPESTESIVANSEPPHVESMYADADLSKPHPKRGARAGHPQMDLGTEDHFLKSEPGKTRAELHLPGNASSEDVFRKMAKDGFAAFEKSGPAAQHQVLKELGLKELTEETLLQAQLKMRRDETGLPSTASYEQLEKAWYKSTYQKNLHGKLPVDYD